MDFFSEDYLMHYGVKGMKWKKHIKRNAVVNPENDLYDSVKDEAGQPHGGESFTEADNKEYREAWTAFRRHGTDADTTIGNKEEYINRIYDRVRERRRRRLSEERRNAYYKNQERINEQIRKTKSERKNKKSRKDKVKRQVSGIKNKVKNTIKKVRKR